MTILFVMLPLILLTGGGVLALFVWAVKADQFEELEDAKHRILEGS
jgi:cbb3-type cytochrome oxidase maturation protein